MDSGTILIIDDNIEFLAEAMAFLINDSENQELSALSAGKKQKRRLKRINPEIIILRSWNE